MSSFKSTVMVGVLTGMLSLLPGCSSGTGDAPKVASVQGIVTLDGQPLANATVAFYPEEGRASLGTTGENGKYTLVYSDSLKGALVGSHRVEITVGSTGGAEGRSAASQEILPDKYHRQTTLTAEVKSGSNQHDFELSSASN